MRSDRQGLARSCKRAGRLYLVDLRQGFKSQVFQETSLLVDCLLRFTERNELQREVWEKRGEPLPAHIYK